MSPYEWLTKHSEGTGVAIMAFALLAFLLLVSHAMSRPVAP